MKALASVARALVAISFGTVAHAIQLNVPTTSVTGFNVFSGPSFVVSGNFGLADIISVEAVGTVDLQFGNFTANAAGVITAPPVTNTGNNPGQTSPALAGAPLPGQPYAALLIGNTTLGFHALFPANAASGLGSPTPPTDILTTRTIGDVFGAPIANGTVLEFRINDINTVDNSGTIRVLNVNATVPDAWGTFASLLVPAALLGTLLCGKKFRTA